ncbi:MAG: macrolide efflux MFS transporter Mef(B) [Firmicutes bacterium HGW-Firmicutes-16]|nr:MAG: macrolide efflux MFS transporter Mef(B) [Firmicutes bacterium HGW-Firmicutes-16]
MAQTANWRKLFFIIYVGQAFSLLSSSAVQFSIIWWITMETGSAMALAIASIIGLLPQAVIGLFAGVWIDRFNRKTIMIIADSAVAVSSLVLGVLFFIGIKSIIVVYIVLFIRALGETFHKPALQAAIPQLVPPQELTKAGGFGQMINSAYSLVGPMIGALLMSVTTLQYAMIVDVLGAALAVSTLSFVKIPKQVIGQRSKLSFIQDIKQGISAFKSNRALLRLTIPMLISTIIFVPLGTLLPLMVKEYFNGTAWHNGIVQTLFSCGMLIAAMVIGITGGLKKQFLMISISTGLLGICAFVGGFLPAQLFWVFCIVVFVMGTTGMGFNIPFTSYIQRTVPTVNLGKVISLVTSVMSFAAPVGMFMQVLYQKLSE